MNTVLILSYTKDVAYYNMLKECMESIDADCDIVVVETNSNLKGKKSWVFLAYENSFKSDYED